MDTDQLQSSREEFGDILLQRSISHFRGQFLTYCLELCGYEVINDSKIGEVCGNKLLTSMILKKNNIPTPKSFFSFNSFLITKKLVFFEKSIFLGLTIFCFAKY